MQIDFSVWFLFLWTYLCFLGWVNLSPAVHRSKQEEMHEYLVLTSLEIQSWLPNWNSHCCTSCILFFHSKNLTKNFRARLSISFRFCCTQFLHNSLTLFQNTDPISSFWAKNKPKISRISNWQYSNLPPCPRGDWKALPLVGALYML